MSVDTHPEDEERAVPGGKAEGWGQHAEMREVWKRLWSMSVDEAWL